jgi:hypothetical protein
MKRFAPTLALLFLLVLIDLLFIGMHAMHVWSPWMKAGAYSIEREGGMGELFQYIKQIWLCASLGILWLLTRGRSFVVWALFFFFLLLDDAFEIHERLGLYLGAELGLPALFGLRPDDLGELMVAGSIGFALMAFVIYVMRAGSDVARRLSADLLSLVIVLALFGVFFDTLHTIAYYRAPSIAPVLALIEDGGEMIVVSTLTVYAFDVLYNAGVIRLPVWGWVRSKWGPARVAVANAGNGV